MEVGRSGGDGFGGKNGGFGELALQRHQNPGAVSSAHQDTIVGLADISDACRKPDTYRRGRAGHAE